MYEETIIIDVDSLRDDMREECLGAYFGVGFGGALVESFNIERASPENLIGIAKKHGIKLSKYIL